MNWRGKVPIDNESEEIIGTTRKGTKYHNYTFDNHETVYFIKLENSFQTQVPAVHTAYV